MATLLNNGQASFKVDLESGFEILQEQRSALLAQARSAQLAASLLTAQEARRLGAVAPGDPRAARLATNSAAMLRRVAALDVEAQIAAIRVPAIDRQETVIQGRVTGVDALGVGQVQVTLADAGGAAVAGVAPVVTDDSGYYAIVLQPAQVANISDTQALTVQLGSAASPVVPAATAPFTLGAGRVIIAQAPLQAAEVGRLRVQPVFTAPVRRAVAPAASSITVAPSRESNSASAAGETSFDTAADVATTPRAPKKKR